MQLARAAPTETMVRARTLQYAPVRYLQQTFKPFLSFAFGAGDSQLRLPEASGHFLDAFFADSVDSAWSNYGTYEKE